MIRILSTTMTGVVLAAAVALSGCGAPADSTPGASASRTAAGTASGTATSTSGTAGASASSPASESSDPAAAAAAGTAPTSSGTASPGQLPSAYHLYTRMRVALTFADSVTFRTTLPGSKQKQQTVVFTGNRDGTNASLLRDTDVETVEVRVVGKTAYLKGDRRYWVQDGAGAKAATLAGRWVSGPTSTFDTQRTDMTMILDSAFAQQPTLDDLKKGRVARTTLDGVPAWTLTGFDGSDRNTLWIAASGDAYPLRLTVEDATIAEAAPVTRGHGEMRFTAWNAAPKVSAPPASQVTPLRR